MTNKLGKLVKQVNEAAGEAVAMIHELDGRILQLHDERRSIGNAPVSRADWLAAIRQTIEARAQRFGETKAGKINQVDRSFFSIDHGAFKHFDFLTAWAGQPVPLSDDGIYWYLQPAIMAKMEEIADGIDWPVDAMPVSERRARIAAIDDEINKLNQQRSTMAAQLQAAGLIG